MKKIYMIYEQDWGHTGITFTNKKSATKFVNFLNDCYNGFTYIKTKNIYDSIEDFTKNNLPEMKEDLKKAIVNLTGEHSSFVLEFKNGNINMGYDQIKKIVEKNKIDFSGWYSMDIEDNKLYKVVKSDLEVVIKKYEEINNKVKNYKDMLKALEENNFEKTFEHF